MADTNIEWTKKTWNPFRGCVKVSPGCKHCYAEAFAERFRGVPGHPYEAGFDPRFVPQMLGQPIGWRRATSVFVNSMSDLFLESFSDEQIAACFGVMALACHHVYQVLTKRADRMRDFMTRYDLETCLNAAMALGVGMTETESRQIASQLPPESPFNAISSDDLWPLPNVILGVSVEDRKHGLPRVDELRQTPAATRMLSVEPLLEDLGQVNLDEIDWLIVGGESGQRVRPFDVGWARRLRGQAQARGIPFFMKQVGSDPREYGVVPLETSSRKGGNESDIPEDLRIRELPAILRRLA